MKNLLVAISLGLLAGCSQSADTAVPAESTPETAAIDDGASASSSAVTQPVSSSRDESDVVPVAVECGPTPTMMSYAESLGDLLADSPLSATVDAILEGARLPRLSPSAAEWSSGDHQTLEIAAWSNCSALASAVLEAGIAPSGVVEGRSPVLAAAVADSWGVVEVLLEAGADPLESEQGDTVLDRAATSVWRQEALPMVLEFVDDMAAVNAMSPSPLHSAVSADRPDSVSLLLSVGATPRLETLVSAAGLVVSESVFELIIGSDGLEIDVEADSELITTICELSRGEYQAQELFVDSRVEAIGRLSQLEGLCG